MDRPARLAFQLAATVDGFDEAVAAVIGWVRRDFPSVLPAGGDSFDVELPGFAARGLAVPEEGLWGARLLSSTRVTEIALARTDGGAEVGVRVLSSTEDAFPPPVVVDLAARCVLCEARPLDGRPWHLAMPEDIETFHRFLTGPERRLPVFLLTQPVTARLGIETPRFLLDAEQLARRTLGAAYVVTLRMALGFLWTERVGKTWSAYLGAVRTYWPRVRFDEDSPYEHPLKMAEAVLAFRYRDQTAIEGFTEMLVDQAFRHAASARVDWGRRKFFEDVRVRRAELDRGRGDGALLEALRQKIERLENEREIALGLAADAESERASADDEAARLRTQLDALRRDYVRKTGADPDALLRPPGSYGEFEEWVRAGLAGRLVLHPRAVRGLRAGAFEDPALVGRALILLANEFRDSRIGGEPGAHRAFSEACDRLGLRFGRSIERSRAGEEGETYFVRHGKDRRFLEFHLRRGGDKDPRYCLAIYFFWDDETRQDGGHFGLRGTDAGAVAFRAEPEGDQARDAVAAARPLAGRRGRHGSVQPDPV